MNVALQNCVRRVTEKQWIPKNTGWPCCDDRATNHMSDLKLKTWSMPSADLGPENPLPPLLSDQELHIAQSVDPAIPDEIRRNMIYGHVPNILPYAMQDGYNRERKLRDFRVAVLENEFLKATFLLEMGGRLWSLYHKPSGRELLSVNPVFQPANLALRNAWFSGGVEWNIGTIGHSPFTCAPLFAALVNGSDGTPVLRMYEWERIRQVTYQIDAWLPNDSPVLFVRIYIRNPHTREIPMYWWSNMAVPETPDTRVIVPAESAYRYTYDHLDVTPVPKQAALDTTYATRNGRAADFFFHIPDDAWPWIAALDGNGTGLVQVSTQRLKGRKLFVWGMGRGGRKWQEFLSIPGQSYLEIQAGLARTQLEHLPMPANTEWEWLEAYGLLEAKADQVHGPDWKRAIRAVELSLQELIPRSKLEAELVQSKSFANKPSVEMIQHGSGWGTLEYLRREKMGERPFASAGLQFNQGSLGDPQSAWLELLETGKFPETDSPPAGSFMVQTEWKWLLEKAVGTSPNWMACLHLGLMRHYAGDTVGAQQSWLQSLALKPNPWSLRNLGMLALAADQMDTAVEHYLEAVHLAPDLPALAVECGQALIAANRPQEWIDVLPSFPDSIRAKGRMRLLEAQARLALGQIDQAGEIIETLPVIEDIREGELSLSELWLDYNVQRLSRQENCPITPELISRSRQQFPLPANLDFRMTDDDIDVIARSAP
jgi:tetratricopeptide (TPR) repeat protein